MKKFTLSSLFIFCFLSQFAQTITLTFTAKDLTTLNTIGLESVLVENLTLGCDTTVYGSSPVLTMPVIVGVHENNPAGNSFFQVMPAGANPFCGKTLVRVFLPAQGRLWLVLSDNIGKRIASYQNDFKPGNHTFEISSNSPGFLLLNACDAKEIKSVKLVNMSSGAGGNGIKYMGNTDGDLKNSAVSPNSGFLFFMGNQLKYTGMAAGYQNGILQDSPISDSTYTFLMSVTATPPTIVTTAVTNITQTTASGGGNVTSDGGAPVTVRGVCWSTSPNPTLAGNSTNDGGGTGIYVSYLTLLSPNTLYYIRAYATNSIGTAYGDELTFTTLGASFTCGSSITINHVTGTVAPVDKTVTYGTVTNIPGEPSKCWITSNLGADHQASAKNDATEPSAGWYWQFNRKQGYKHTGTVRTPNTTWISNISENSDWLPANDPCTLELGAGWRLPTATEWINVYTYGNWTNWNGPWDSGLKLHAAGQLLPASGSLNLRGVHGRYRSSTQDTANWGENLIFGSGFCEMWGDEKAYGNTARCLKE